MTAKTSFHAICAAVLLAQAALAEDAPRFLALNQGTGSSYTPHNIARFMALPGRSGTTTLHQRQNTVLVSRPTAQQPTTQAPQSMAYQPSFAVRRYEPRPRAVFRLRQQPTESAASGGAPVRSSGRGAVAPLPRDNNGNREFASNAPYSSAFYGASHIGITEHSWPVELSAKQRVSSGFGMRRHPVTGSHAFHKGVDIAAPTGTEVQASADGVVEETGSDRLIGNYVRLRHPDGSQSLYGHLSAIFVKEAAWLNRHQPLGAVGATGRTTGPHLHFALNVDGDAMDPMPYLRRAGQQLASR